MEARLMHFVLHIASPHLTHIIEHFGKYRLVDGDPTNIATTIFVDFKKTIVRNVEGGAKLMAGVLRRILIEIAKALHILLGAEHGSNQQLVRRIALCD